MNGVGKSFKVAVLLACALFVAATAGNPSAAVQRIVREAESLTVVQDRLMATTVLVRNIKKLGPEEGKFLKEKLHFLSRNFYSEKGFQSYLRGKELFEGQKYTDALEKFYEADESEKGNVEVLHLTALAQVAAGKPDLAEATNKRALLLCPFDIELQRDQLSIYLAQEKWAEAVKTADTLMKEFGDGSAQTFKDRGFAHLKLDHKIEARKFLEMAQQKDKKLPGSYYWLSTLRDKPEAQKLLAKYVELCKDKATPHYDREPGACAMAPDAEKRLK